MLILSLPKVVVMETFKITCEDNIVTARMAARQKGAELGLSMVNKTRIATAVSELARNCLTFGGGGKMEMDIIENNKKQGLRFVFTDEGPGIQDIEKALDDGFSTGNGLGQGLPGSRRLMDELKIESEPGQGTRVEIIKWKR